VKILLVEDDPVQCNIVSGFLHRYGHEVDTAATRDRALDLLNSNHYDVAVVDLVLAVSTGDTVAYHASLKGMAVVLISAANVEFMNTMKDTLELRGATIASVLTKPFTPAILNIAINHAAANRPEPKPIPPEPPIMRPEVPVHEVVPNDD
jgi:two-component system response regulator ResD